MIVVTFLGAAPAVRRPLRRIAPPVPERTRVTVIDAGALGEPSAWLERAADALVPRALALVDELVAAHRVAAADPYVADAPAERALVGRVGYGSGEQVADGSWEAARELTSPASPRARRRADDRPQQRLAALLAARDVALACEELALRARADLDHGRPAVAALQLEAALGAALAELEGWRERRDMTARLEELGSHRAAVAAAAAAARAGTLDPAGVDAVRAALGRLEAALRARAVATAWE